jgi:type I restriction enzyme M protein
VNPVCQHLLLRVAASSNPPFNDSEGGRKDDDVRWQFGAPPKGSANFVWVQQFIRHPAPVGMAGLIHANGSMSSNQTGDDDIQATFRERAYASFAA